jgi:hypothetical protein
MASEIVSEEKNVTDAPDSKREQSTIVFPYLDLDAAVEVARSIYNRSGYGPCDLDELAAEMKQTMSGAFRLKTGTAKTFDLVAKEGKGGVKLSELGRQAVSSGSERAARAEAFMRVPLYAAIFEKYRGHLLPPMKALEREMIGLGVSYKQADKARQVFERSAKQAGYFESGEDRLVRPKYEIPTKQTAEKQGSGEFGAKRKSDDSDESKGVVSHGGYHPFIEGLLKTLPTVETEWPSRDRAKWLKTAANMFDLIYKGGDAEIEVTLNEGK